ncbi:SLIT1-like protein [Mya arenaria]|uniref:SLIT1-like protein n=1 Tax=Mya arenaria TaxID=6604 RepID=A0ABY7DA25_MYAAR|nr:SLIT1-like protein [Mya arenaria]
MFKLKKLNMDVFKLRNRRDFVYCLVVLLQICSVSASDDELCPLSCECTREDNTTDALNVVCDSFYQFTGNIPANTKYLVYQNSRFDYLPMNAFMDYKLLKSISFVNASIGTVRACSFAELESMERISFEKCQIDVIQGNAFSNLGNIDEVIFREVSVNDITSFAFHNLTHLDYLTFEKVYIRLINRYSFQQLNNIKRVKFANSRIDYLRTSGFSKIANLTDVQFLNISFGSLHCNTLDTLAENTNTMTMTNLLFNCTCGLAWMWKEFSNESSISPFASQNGNTCAGKGDISGIGVAQACPDADSRGEGCQPLLPSPPHSCSKNYDEPLNPVTKCML